MMLQYMEIKDQYEGIILFFRLGDFYEMFFEDAIEVSHLLELTLTGKNAGLEDRIPMCGVPHHSSEIYINKLIELGKKVAICEQVEDPAISKGIVKREVLQVISKGTVMDSTLDEKNNNYIGSIIDFTHCYILSYADISTGNFYTTLLEHDDDTLVKEVLSVGITELVTMPNINLNLTEELKVKNKIHIDIFDKKLNTDEYSYIYSDITDSRHIESIKHLLSFISDTQKRSLTHFQKALIIDSNAYLKMDINTKRNLELTESLRLKSRNFSLIWLLDKTKTAMGSRKLKSFIERPLVDKSKIEKRYDVVSNLLEEFILKEELRGLLYEIYDLERLVGRVSFGNANAKDLLQLKSSLKVLPNIKSILKQLEYYETIDTLEDIYILLENSIYDNPPNTLKEGYLIKDGYNSELDSIKDARKGGKDFILKLEQEEKDRTKIKNLKVGYNKIFGFYIEISKGNIHLIKEEFGYERKQTLANCERYITPLLKEKEALILGAEEKIVNLEYNLFIEIRDKIKNYIPVIQDIARVISEVDVLQSFATVTEENNYIRPTLVDERIIDIKNSRHPVVEKVIKEEFVSNDIYMDENTNILLITGPNMAGKSTYMRELVISVIMAQAGCFIPASSAKMMIFDKIFTRIGASDDLVSGESTFMVEMKEANNAIEGATKNSLIIFDELGRGTATFDGMAIAQSIIEYIHDNIKAKTLFSTHYHELTNLETNFKNLKNIHVSALEEDGKIVFLHKIKKGAIDKSYGIHVAKLANLPDKLIKRASDILKTYESDNKKTIYVQEEIKFEDTDKNKHIIDKIRNVNPLEISPLESLNILYELKNNIDKEQL